MSDQCNVCSQMSVILELALPMAIAVRDFVSLILKVTKGFETVECRKLEIVTIIVLRCYCSMQA